MIALYASIFFLMVAIALFILSASQRRKTGLPGGRVIYSDTTGWNKVMKPLYDPELGLAGKPDYLVEQGKQLIPVEVKSSHSPKMPYDSHIFQLAAYCLLVEREYGFRPRLGMIHYSDRTFAIDFTSTLAARTEAVIQEMQGLTTHSKVNRSHDNPRSCQHCGYRSICDQALRI